VSPRRAAGVHHLVTLSEAKGLDNDEILRSAQDDRTMAQSAGRILRTSASLGSTLAPSM
jgi:hypothetical protein